MRRERDTSGPARRAVVRWAWRVFRREWRQQALVVAMVAFAVGVAVFGVSASYNVVSSRDGEFGTANHRFRFQVADVDSVTAQLDRFTSWFGTAEAIGRHDVKVAASAKPVEIRAQDPHGRFGTPMLRLRAGRYPSTATDIAVTEQIAELLSATVGSTIELDGQSRSVVGLVENPARLDDEFVLSPYDRITDTDSVTVLVSTTPERATSLPEWAGNGTVDRRPACHAALICLSSGQSEQATAGAAALGLATLLLMLVALVAASAFVVFAQRRLRQLGLLAATGATERQLRVVVLTNGAIVGSLAAVLGGTVGTLGWVFAAPSMEAAAGHRIARSHLPLWLIAAALVLATVISIVAAWSPARRIAHVPIMAALSERPPLPAPLRRSALVAAGLIAAGAAALSQALDRAADHVNPALLIGGIAALVIGVVRLSPRVLGALGRLGSHLPIAPRIALRDLARYRARSSAALAALTLGLAIPVAAIVVASEAKASMGEGNLATGQLIVRIGDEPQLIPERSAEQLDRLQREIDTFAAELGATALPLDVATDPTTREARGSESFQRAAVLGRHIGNGFRDAGVLYVATPSTIAQLGLDSHVVDRTADVLTSLAGTFGYANTGGRPDDPTVASIARSPYSSMPTSLITPAAVAKQQWTTTRAGWLVERSAPLTADQRRAARDLARAAGLTVEVRDQQPELGTIGAAATAFGALLALGLLALTVGLLRVENRAELGILSATGATTTIRRTLTATTTTALALSGVLLGTLAAYTGLVAGYGGFTQLGRPPVTPLAVLLLGVPATATLVSWLVAGSRAHLTIQRAE